MRVLIADDNPPHRKLLRVSLRTMGHDCIEAADGAELLELLAREKVDAVITDILMPNVDGYRVSSEIRKTPGLENLPVILYSSTYQSPGDAELALRFGASAYLTKPATPELIHATLKKAAEQPRPPSPAAGPDELGTLKQYSDRLVTKIEEKNLELQLKSIELAASQEKFRQLAENIQEVFWMNDLATLQMLYVSPGYERIWGRQVSELYKNPDSWQRSIHAEDRDRVRDFMSRLRPDSGPYTLEYRIVQPGGAVRNIVARGFPVHDAEGRVYRIAGIAQDVTEQRDLERQFLQAQKMEAVGRLAGGVAHDFNNLLTAIIGYSQLALDRIPPEDPLHLEVKEILKAGDRAAGLTRQLLSFSRKQILQPRIVDLNAVVSDVERMLKRLIGEDIELTTSLSRNLPATRIDPGQLEQIIVNLVVNARDAMPQGGRIMIESRLAEIDADYSRRHPEIQPGSHLLLAITDSGTGMTDEVKAHLFEPFFTTKEVGKGTGLGLATVHGILKQSGGHINVYSELGRGTTFKIYLPLAERAEPELKPGATGKSAPGGTEIILIVEDDPLVRALTESVLSRAGYRVLRARRGEEAVGMLEKSSVTVDLLITDVVMPGMNGVDLSRKAKEMRPGIRLLHTSGYTDTSLLKDGFLPADVPFLTKPFTPDSLLRLVRRTLDQPPSP